MLNLSTMSIRRGQYSLFIVGLLLGFLFLSMMALAQSAPALEPLPLANFSLQEASSPTLTRHEPRSNAYADSSATSRRSVTPSKSPSVKPAISSGYELQSPVMFIENVGQFDSKALFV
ncbi:MAG: hypothetical protein ACK2UI_13970, partial [Anaerolineae bacterium]